MARKISIDTALKRFRVQAVELDSIRKKSLEGEGMNAVYTDYVTCQGVHPGRLSGEGHKKCNNRISIAFAYKCLYCNYWFCATCAELHFGKTRKEYKEERLKAEAVQL